jgi:hypothetical protein
VGEDVHAEGVHAGLFQVGGGGVVVVAELPAQRL